jgi:hypothetical protein
MLLQTVIDHLKTGEFSLENLGGNIDDGVTSNNTHSIINYINLGLIDLYKRFNLSIKEIHLQQFAQIQKYTLSSKYALSNLQSEHVKYIIDTLDAPFKNDILLITNVYNEIGCELPLNDSNKEGSVFTPKYNVIQIPCPKDENSTIITYRASPELLVCNCDFTQEVEIPYTFLECLLFFVASRFKASRPNQESLIESNNYAQKYQASIDLIKMEGLYNSSLNTSVKLCERGFV